MKNGIESNTSFCTIKETIIGKGQPTIGGNHWDIYPIKDL